MQQIIIFTIISVSILISSISTAYAYNQNNSINDGICHKLKQQIHNMKSFNDDDNNTQVVQQAKHSIDLLHDYVSECNI